jgi:RNase H-fold protein (predicted Holliday junction resolvase)
MTIKSNNVLWIDRWSKYIWVAYGPIDQDVIFPVGYVMNDQMAYFNIADIIQRHHIRKIVLGRPWKQEDIQLRIKEFIQSLWYIIDTKKIPVELVNEDYSSVESWEIVSNFKKNVAEDTVSAMVILERRRKQKNDD